VRGPGRGEGDGPKIVVYRHVGGGGIK